MIIDTHVHIYTSIHGKIAQGKTTGTYYGCADIEGNEIQVIPPFCYRTSHTAEMLIKHMDITGIDKAVLLQGAFYGNCNKYVLEAVRKYPRRLAAAAFFDPWLPGGKNRFEHICRFPEFKAVKLECSVTTGLFGIHPEANLYDSNIAWLWDEMERRGLILTVDLGVIGSRSYQTEAIESIAIRNPGLKIVIAHLAQPEPSLESDNQKMTLWKKQIGLALNHNVWFDMASLPAYFSKEGFPFDSAEKYIRLAIDRIGPEKLLWGTDMPGMLIHITYGQLLQLARKQLSFLKKFEQDMILGENALKMYFG